MRDVCVSRLPQLQVGDLLLLLAEEQLLARAVDGEVAQQRLGVGGRQPRIELRVEAARGVAGRQLRRVPRQVVAAAAPRHQLLDAGVGAQAVVGQGEPVPVRKLPGGVVLLRVVDCEEEARPERGARLGDAVGLRSADSAARRGCRGCSPAPSSPRRRTRSCSGARAALAGRVPAAGTVDRPRGGAAVPVRKRTPRCRKRTGTQRSRLRPREREQADFC